MSTLPKILQYRGALYRQVHAEEETAVDKDAFIGQIKDEVDKAVAALGGHRTGQKIGGPDKLRDGGEPWSTEVTVKVSKLQPETDLATAFPFSTIEWWLGGSSFSRRQTTTVCYWHPGSGRSVF